MSKFENRLSEGSVVKQLMKFALPFIISNVIQSLYSVADMVIVGRFSGASSAISMSGVNLGSQVTMLVTNLVIGLAAGATVLIAQYLGANDRKSLKDTIGSLLTILLVSSVFVTILMVALRTPILRLIQTPEPAFEEAKSYLTVTSLGTIFIFMYNALSAILRGMGDSKRPLYFVCVAAVVNIGLDLLFVWGWGMKAFGAGLATIISQAISVLLCIIYLKRSDFIFDFNIKSFGFNLDKTKLLLKVGLPMSAQNVCTSISFLFLTTIVNILDPTAIASAAVGAVGKLNGFGVLPAFAMSNAISAMSAQNFGAGLQDRAVKTMKIGTAISFAISFAVFIFIRFFPEFFISLFTPDTAVIEQGVIYLKSFSYDYLLVPLMSGLNGLFIGAGHTTFSLFNGMISSILVRIPTCYLFGIALDMGLSGVGLGAPCATCAAFIIGIIYFFSGHWKKNKIISQEMLHEI